MEKYHGNTVEYWKQNAEENYLTTPISVLKYITVLEEQAEQLRKHAVSSSVCPCSELTNGEMEELKIWLEGFIIHTEKKIENMKQTVPDHRNTKRFEGEVSMAKKTVNKIDELSKK